MHGMLAHAGLSALHFGILPSGQVLAGTELTIVAIEKRNFTEWRLFFFVATPEEEEAHARCDTGHGVWKGLCIVSIPFLLVGDPTLELCPLPRRCRTAGVQRGFEYPTQERGQEPE